MWMETFKSTLSKFDIWILNFLIFKNFAVIPLNIYNFKKKLIDSQQNLRINKRFLVPLIYSQILRGAQKLASLTWLVRAFHMRVERSWAASEGMLADRPKFADNLSLRTQKSSQGS